MRRLKIVWNVADRSILLIVAHPLGAGTCCGGLCLRRLLFGVHPISWHVQELFQWENHRDIAVIMKIKLTLLLFDVVSRVFFILRLDPNVISQVRCWTYFSYLVFFHLILRKSLLHTAAQEILAVFRKTVEDFDHSKNLFILLFAHSRIILNGVNHTAAGLNVWYPS